MPIKRQPHSLAPCRLIVEGAGAAARQMAVDEVLLESAAADRRATLRFYQWSRPALSLGYFQRIADRDAHPASRDCDVVRRQTGGGAILHDRELTYSLAIPCAHPLATDATRLYKSVHDCLVRVLADHGVSACRRTTSEAPGARAQPFLCFLSHTAGDVLVQLPPAAQAKVCGSAQKRRRGAILQHGSLLLARSEFAPELAGILELTGRALDSGVIAAAWGQEIGRALEVMLEIGELSAVEQQCARQLARDKYAQARWTVRR